MQIKQYIQGIAKAVVRPVFKALSNVFPGAGERIVRGFGGRFRWLLEGRAAYDNKIFYSGLNILVKKLVEVPILFSVNKESAKTKFTYDRFYSKNTTNEKRFVIKKLGLEELSSDHAINKLFDNPNTYSSRIELMEDFWYNYGFGDGFLWFEPIGIGRDSSKPGRVHSLARNRVEVVKSDNNMDPVAGYWYTCLNGTRIPLEKDHVLHMKRWNPNGADLRGLGVDQVAAMQISIDNEMDKAQGAALVNGGRGTIFSSGSTRVDSASGTTVRGASKDQMEALQDTVEADFAGAANNRKMYFSNGEVNAQNYGDTLAEMELIKAGDSSWKNIFTIIGVPWALSPAASSVTENSVIIAFKSLVTNTVVPELRKFDQKLKKMLSQWWPDVIPCHDLTEFNELAPDLKLMKEVYGTPLLTIDEGRAIFGHDELPNGLGNHVLVDSGKMKLEDILADATEDPENDPENEL